MPKFSFDALGALFDRQIEILKSNPEFLEQDAVERLVKSFSARRAVVIQEASELDCGYGNIPFLPVVHHWSDRTGLYYAYDIEDGAATLGMSPAEAVTALRAVRRYPLSVYEANALVNYTDVLTRHSVFAPATRFSQDQSCVAGLHNFTGGGGWVDDGPGLAWFPDSTVHPRWGTPSCAIGLDWGRKRFQEKKR